MDDKEQELLETLQRLAEGCAAYAAAQHWARWFKRDHDDFQSALQSRDREKARTALADIRRALWGGMGAFCDGGAPDPALETLGHKAYRLVAEIERKNG